jgi:dihydropyrimidine dehydrogenase (NAD+) subunit PreT
LGGTCGTVCPVSKLCESACTRKSIDSSIKIGAVQRYLHDFGLSKGLTNPPCAQKTGHKIAIIGAGPAGLAAARDFARAGSNVTVFERRSEAGGALRYALSPVRINHDFVEEEVKRIKDLGVTFLFDNNIDNPQDLIKEGFHDVFVSPGLQDSRMVNIVDDKGISLNSQTNRVITALSFLESANTHIPHSEKYAFKLCNHKHVTVIGGGSVAMDCAVTAKSLGAKSVNIVARESLLNLPADIDEIKLARKAGAVFHPESQVTHMSHNDLVHIAGINDSSGSTGAIVSSVVIVAAGQQLDDVARKLIDASVQHYEVISVAKAESVLSNSKSTTTSKTIFAGGDAVRGGGDMVVRAVADGKKAVKMILPNTSLPSRNTISLETEFCGIKFENPFCLSSSPVTNSAEMIARAYDAGWGGAYYKTLNREDIFTIYHPSPRLGVVHGGRNAIEIGIQNVEQISDRPLADNLKDIEWLRKHYPNKVTAVSIMGFSNEDWAYLAAAAEVSI